MKKLPDAELKIMSLLWDVPPPVTRWTVSQELSSKGWRDTTILTMLSRLVKKGFLSVKKSGNKNLYTPIISREQYMTVESGNIRSRAENLSISGLMAAMIDTDGITDHEIDEIERLIKEYKSGC